MVCSIPIKLRRTLSLDAARSGMYGDKDASAQEQAQYEAEGRKQELEDRKVDVKAGMHTKTVVMLHLKTSMHIVLMVTWTDESRRP